ncbi:alginate lyase family protein [Formosa sp. PL04]|uniref:alginate lyase family protein n=1 Tax=Formosa sp. PL04 TaxID=3081755 RepID=UPI0029816105|nr:alginate lyase family protein [Formosa sp. PL04]MDW5290397.1 alginate lyase family protein [Formosa sp. PL04]
MLLKRIVFICCVLIVQNGFSQEHPNLILTKQGVKDIKAQLGNVPLFDATLAQVKANVDAQIEKGIDVPVPKDMAGGYTHDQHKLNYLTMQEAGVLYQIYGDEKYAIYVKDMLMEYAKMYKGLPRHPQERSYARGKLFWQCLNDSVWLVYTAQAYDCIYDFLSKKEVKHLEKDLFKPMADFLSIETPQFFNRIHNHSTWGNVAVGMIALVMDDDVLLDRALYGIKGLKMEEGVKDNDGAFISVKGQKAGFLANLEEPFSPDGYYTEGAYYQRYAMYPFMIFAEGLQNVEPETKPFEYKNGVLLKGVDALLNLTDKDGEFFALNDSQKGMSYYTASLVSAVDIAYYYGKKDVTLLSIAKEQGRVQLDQTGLAVAMDIRDGKAKPFEKKSILLTDGAKGDEGAIGILRSTKNDDLTLVMKNAAQGLSHGHYDKLSFSLFHEGNEVVQDYGLARFVNIEQKNGGGYLKENKTWAKQTIAHNTIIQDETSHFNGDYAIGSLHHSDMFVFDIENPDVQIVSAKEKNAYPGTVLQRTMVMLNHEDFIQPVVLDLMQVNSDKKHQFDLPFYFLGQVISTSFSYKQEEALYPLGKEHGYQHLWKEAVGASTTGDAALTWMEDDTLYTITTTTTENDSLIFGRIGANDPEYNLRPDPVLIVRKNTDSALFASVIETHGTYSAVSELSLNAFSSVKHLSVLQSSEAYSAVNIIMTNGDSFVFIMSNSNDSKTEKHSLTIESNTYTWTGVNYFEKQ